MKFDASLAASAVGSFPHRDPVAACKLILEYFPEIPVWPQLPSLGLLEQMEIQYSEGFPCVVVDYERERMYFDTANDSTSSLEKFYENIILENVNYFAISADYARGIRTLEKVLQGKDISNFKYFKMQVTGPVSFALSTVDENKRALYYNDVFRDVVVKGISMKARWQLRRFKPLCQKRICIIDEPILSAFGSSTYVSVKRDDVVSMINEVVEAIHAEGGLAGIHCCGNTEWTIPIDAGVDIINFDAFEYAYSIVLYPKEIQAFLKKGGVLSWGMIPTSEKVGHYTTISLAYMFDQLIKDMTERGVDKELLLRNSLITASCGTGTVPEDRAARIAQLTWRVSSELRERHAKLLGI